MTDPITPIGDEDREAVAEIIFHASPDCYRSDAYDAADRIVAMFRARLAAAEALITLTEKERDVQRCQYESRLSDYKTIAAECEADNERLRKQRDAAEAALGEVSEFIRIDHLDMGGNHRYCLRRNGKPLREFMERVSAVLGARGGEWKAWNPERENEVDPA